MMQFVRLGGIILSSAILYSSVKGFIEDESNRKKLEVKKENYLRIYICAYQSFHTSLCLEYGDEVIEYEWNTFENEDNKLKLGLLKNIYTKGRNINWEEKEIAELIFDIESFDSLIDHIDSQLMEISMEDYNLFGNNCRTFVDKVIQIIEDYLNAILEKDVTLKRCKNFAYSFGSGFEIQIGKSYEKFVLLLSKLFINVQQKRKGDYLMDETCLYTFDSLKFKG